MDRTDERRRRPPQTQAQRHAQAAAGRQPDRRPADHSRPVRRPDESRYGQPTRQRRPGEGRQPQRSRAPQHSPQEQPRRRSYEEAPRARRSEEPVRRRPPQETQRRRTYEEQTEIRRDPSVQRSYEQRRERREQERRRRQRRRQRNLAIVLLVVIASMASVFCLYDPEDGVVRLPRPDIEAHTDEPPTEPPTEKPTRPPIVVTPISSLEDLATLQVPDYVDVQIIDVDGDSRRGAKLRGINDIVIHYVGNPGTTAQQNRNWYADIYSNVSSHFVVGLNGEVIQCVPLDEASSASNNRNFDTISIEICHPDTTGKFNNSTYESVVDLCAWLVKACGLELENVIRHYEVTGKICPKYYVENDDAWQQLRADILARMSQ